MTTTSPTLPPPPPRIHWYFTVDASGNILTVTEGEIPSDGILFPPETNAMTVAPNPTAFTWDGTTISRKPDTLAQAQSAQNALNHASYQLAIQGPVSFTSAGGITAMYQANPQSIANLQSVILGFQLKQATPSGFYWRAANNTNTPFTYADLLGLAQAMAEPAAAAWAKMQSLKAQVAAATTVAEVQAVIWS
jgi:hypothetical protein